MGWEHRPNIVAALKQNMYSIYEKLEKVGEGTYGKVYKAKHKITGQLVALKKTRLETEDEGVPATAVREVSLIQMLSKDPHFVRLLDVQHKETKSGKPMLFLIFEYLESDLKNYIDDLFKSQKKMPVMEIKRFMYQLCNGIAYCHGHGVLHRDLKPSNLLVNKETGMIKIADLGLGRAFTIPVKEYTHEIVTLWYRAPEVLLGATHYSTSIDMWSVGCIFAELYRLRSLFHGDSELQQILHIFKLLGTPNEDVWPGVSKLNDWHEYPRWRPDNLSSAVPDMEPNAVDLLSKMLCYEPLHRISAKRALMHPYFDDLDKSQL
eukprot:Gb_22030 [translate_table: standard]